MVEGQLHDILVVSRRFEDKRMNLFTQEIRKNPEGLAFDQATPSFWHLAEAWSLLSFKRTIL